MRNQLFYGLTLFSHEAAPIPDDNRPTKGYDAKRKKGHLHPRVTLIFWTMLALPPLVAVSCAHSGNQRASIRYSLGALPILAPAGATAAHRALADKLANAFGEPSSDVCN